MPRQFLLEDVAGLDEEAPVNGFAEHAHAGVVREPPEEATPLFVRGVNNGTYPVFSHEKLSAEAVLQRVARFYHLRVADLVHHCPGPVKPDRWPSMRCAGRRAKASRELPAVWGSAMVASVAASMRWYDG